MHVCSYMNAWGTCALVPKQLAIQALACQDAAWQTQLVVDALAFSFTLLTIPTSAVNSWPCHNAHAHGLLTAGPLVKDSYRVCTSYMTVRAWLSLSAST